mmetsp:Transcript_8468/g.27120  ORF Transcript_8468/g.27120 Transcript_8468/m.27120 type:complete len:237 (+) Transcript_8468:1449-2159(+)
MCSLVANANNIFTTILVISNELSSFPQNATALHTSLNIVALHVIIISTFSVAAEFVPLTLTFSFSTKFITKNKHSSAFTATFCLPPCEYTSWLLKISLHASVTSRKIFVFFSKCKKSDFFSSSLVCVQNCFISSSLVLVLVLLLLLVSSASSSSSSSSESSLFKHEMLTKGDNNYMDDIGLYAPGQKWLNEKHVMGRTVGYLPHVGKATILMNDHPMIKYALIFILGLLVISGKEG